METIPSIGRIQRLEQQIAYEQSKMYQWWLIHRSHKTDFQYFSATPELWPIYHALIRELENCIVERNNRMNELALIESYRYQSVFSE